MKEPNAKMTRWKMTLTDYKVMDRLSPKPEESAHLPYIKPPLSWSILSQSSI